MSWRRGELWLDTDVLWFREPAAVPAFAGFAPPPIFSSGVATGLGASRRRREASRHRRNVRRVRTAALVLSPAVVLPFALPRLNGGQRSALELEDPPSLTLRLGPKMADAADLPDPRILALKSSARERLAASVSTAPTPARRPVTRRHVAAAQIYPAVEWHDSSSQGLPYDGTLVNGTQLPVDGENWVTWDPVTDSVPNAPDRLYGDEHTIREVISVVDSYRATHPDAPRVVVGDISRKGGGPMTDEHVSHQNGLDVDVYYPRLDHRLQAPTASDQIDLRLSQDLVDLFVAAGAQMIFVGYGTGLHGPSGVVIPYANHEYHMHVRFPAPQG